MKIWLICLLSGIILLLGWLFYKFYDKKALLGKRLLINMAAACAVLTVMNTLSGFTQLSVPVNMLSLGTGMALGAPGILGLFAMKLFM